VRDARCIQRRCSVVCGGVWWCVVMCVCVGGRWLSPGERRGASVQCGQPKRARSTCRTRSAMPPPTHTRRPHR
jgi:hypothetical protein